MQTSCLVLMAHGSRDPRWCAPFEALLEQLRHELGTDRVALAYIGVCFTDPAGHCRLCRA